MLRDGYPAPPAQVAVYVDVLGPQLAMRFLLEFGGADLHIPAQSTGRSRLDALIGRANVDALAARRELMQRRVPLAKRWLAACLRHEGRSVADIARTLRVTDVSVRRMLADGPGDTGAP